MNRKINKLITKAQNDDRVEDLLTAIIEFFHEPILMRINEKPSGRGIDIEIDNMGTIKGIKFIGFKECEINSCIIYVEKILFKEEYERVKKQKVIFSSEKFDLQIKVGYWFQLLPLKDAKLNECGIYPLLLEFVTDKTSDSTISLNHLLNDLETIISFLNISTEVYFYYEFYNSHNLFKIYDLESKPVRTYLNNLNIYGNKDINNFTKIINIPDVINLSKFKNLLDIDYISSFNIQQQKSPKSLLLKKFQNSTYWYSKSIELYEVNFSLSFISLLFALEGLIFESIKHCNQCGNPEMEGLTNLCEKCALPKYMITKKVKQLLECFDLGEKDNIKFYNKISNKRTRIVHQSHRLTMDSGRFYDFPSQILMQEDKKDYERLKGLVKAILFKWIMNKNNKTEKFLDLIKSI